MPHLGPLHIEKQLGSGDESVYLWYNEAEAYRARRRRHSVWACKIGRTKGIPDGRIVSQGAGTAFSDVPNIGLVLKTDDSQTLEAMIHAALRGAGRHISNFRGTEWFRTNPNEVKTLYQILHRAKRFLSH